MSKAAKTARSEPDVEPAMEREPADELAVSVVVPCFNEMESLEELHREIVAALDGVGEYEVVYVDDGSRDGTAEVLQALHDRDMRVEVVNLRRNAGKATALAAGFRHARGRVVCTLDADLQDDPAELPALVARVDRGEWDLIVGWKRKRRDPVTKVVPSRVFNWMLRRVSSARLHDFNCGLKVMDRDVAAAVPLYGDLYRFMPAFAAARGFSVTEQEVSHRPRRYGHSKYGASRFLRGFLDLLTLLLLTRFRTRPLHLFGGLGLLLVVAGLGVLTYLTVLWFQGLPIGQRPLLLFGVLLFLTGLQGIAIGLIAEMIGHARNSARDELGPNVRLRSHREKHE